MKLTSHKLNAKKVFMKHHANARLAISEGTVEDHVRRAGFRFTYDDRVMYLEFSPSECKNLMNMFEMTYVKLMKGGKNESNS